LDIHHNKISVFIVGDSTASYYSADRAPRAGWGQVLQTFFTDDILIVNEAASGRSSKSFIDEGRLKKVRNEIKQDDYLLIQFGHNDAKKDERYAEPYTTYKSFLQQYIDVAKKKGAQPILITPVQRRSFHEDGYLVDTHNDYPLAMLELGKQTNSPVIDLGVKSKELFQELGIDKTKEIFLWLEPGEHTNYPDGVQDNTHFSEKGATEVAKLIVEGIQKLKIPLQKYINVNQFTKL
jgi:lysophospholipase L1-like esterase